jgi:hypothetical protein
MAILKRFQDAKAGGAEPAGLIGVEFGSGTGSNPLNSLAFSRNADSTPDARPKQDGAVKMLYGA